MSIPNEITVESIEVPKELARVMQDIPRKFNETLTDWADRCKQSRAPKQETGSSSLTNTT